MVSVSVILIGCAYMALLVVVARIFGRRQQPHEGSRRRAAIYALSLTVYCTSWIYFGAVGDALTEGWPLLAYYIGPALAVTLGRPLWQRLLRAVKREKVASLADFLSNRYGKSRSLGIVVTMVALVAAMPHIALQLRSLVSGWAIIAHSDTLAPAPLALVVAGVLLAMFAILLGGRRADLNEASRGLVYTLSAPAVIKLFGLVVLSIFALNEVGWDRILPVLRTTELAAQPHVDELFISTLFLTASALFCFPKQFHVGFVTAADEEDSRYAAWLLPLYLGIALLAILPIIVAGQLLPPEWRARPDVYALTFPLAAGQPALTSLVAIGAFSAAASAIVVETIALAAMVSNEMVLPWMTWRARTREAEDADFSTVILRVRQFTMALVVGGACIFILITDSAQLRSFGAASFIAAAQLMPALIGAVYWERASFWGAIGGISAGMLAWAGCGLFFGVTGQNFPGHPGLGSLLFTVEFSVGLNILVFVGLSLLVPTRMIDRIQARSFVRGFLPVSRLASPRLSTRVGELVDLIAHFIGEQRARESFAQLQRTSGRRLDPSERVTADVALAAERMLAGAIGSASARGVISTALATRNSDPSDIVAILDDAAHAVEFSRGLLQSTLDNLPQGVCVFDADQRLSVWNSSLSAMFALGSQQLWIGQSWRAIHHWIGEHAAEPFASDKWCDQECLMLDGHWIAMSVAPMADAGAIVTFHDVTEFRRQAADLREGALALERANETLETKVLERTRALAEAKLRAERADAAKTRFLAAASHDLLQPLHAARLFVGALQGDLGDRPASAAIARDADIAIDSADRMLRALLNLSRLDALDIQPTLVPIGIGEIVQEVARQFGPSAAAKGLTLRTVESRAVLLSDPDLMRSILQNFVSNAIRYTDRGGVLIGCRAEGEAVRIEVWDSGRGISADTRERIFAEYVQLEDTRAAAEGMGLGLAIIDRVARRLGHRVDLRSVPGRGSVFSVTVPRAASDAIAPDTPLPLGEADLSGLRVLCVDDDDAILTSMAALLGRWNVAVSTARSVAEVTALGEIGWEAALIDYRLGDGTTGLDVLARVADRIGRVAIVTADASPELAQELEKIGVELLRKPLDAAVLQAFLADAYASEILA